LLSGPTATPRPYSEALPRDDAPSAGAIGCEAREEDVGLACAHEGSPTEICRASKAPGQVGVAAAIHRETPGHIVHAAAEVPCQRNVPAEVKLARKASSYPMASAGCRRSLRCCRGPTTTTLPLESTRTSRPCACWPWRTIVPAAAAVRRETDQVPVVAGARGPGDRAASEVDRAVEETRGVCVPLASTATPSALSAQVSPKARDQRCIPDAV